MTGSIASRYTAPMSNTARDRILTRIRTAQGRGRSRPSLAESDAVQTYLRRRPRGPVRALESDPVARFRTRAESMQSTSELVARTSEVPAAVQRYLQAHQLPMRGCVWPQLADLPWQACGVVLRARAAVDADLVGVTGAFAAIAETGTLMVVSGPTTPASASLLVETHIAIIKASRIVAYMEDAWQLARDELGQLPRAVNFISGPSRTADIEQVLVLGAHGPYRVHLIIVTEE
jgi:L-lactate dehydrogenase complex protein LldG